MTELYDGAEAVAVLPVADATRSEAWYGRLGFTTVASYPGYRILEAGSLHIHLAEHDDVPADAPGSGVYLYVTDVDAVHQTWAALGARIIAEPLDQPYGVREFATEDPDGNLWRIVTPLGAPATSPESAADRVLDGDREEDLEDRAGRSDDHVDGATLPPNDALSADDAPPPTDGSPGTGPEHWVDIVAAGRPCAGCGTDASIGPAGEVGGRLRDEAHRWRTLLASADDDALRRRPRPEVWSALEYAVHTRDVVFVYTERISRTLAEDHPELTWWDHEAAITDEFANESDVSAVADDLVENAERLGQILALVQGARWERTATRDENRFTVEGLARFTLHEIAHHRVDAERSLDRTARP